MGVITKPANLAYKIRREAEQDRRYKQLIPYVLMISGDRVLQYERGQGGEEKRLHGLYSIGVGGHIAEDDHLLFSKDALGYYEGMRREIKEEVGMEPGKETAVALINDDSTEVGIVHFGVVHVMRVASEKIAGGKTGIKGPKFVPIAEAARKSARYESWSRLCLENMALLMARAEG